MFAFTELKPIAFIGYPRASNKIKAAAMYRDVPQYMLGAI